jgi:hypothetical protein
VFTLLFFGCDSYYDPWLERSRFGFAGGKAETFLLLVCFHGLMMTCSFALFAFSSARYVEHLQSANLVGQSAKSVAHFSVFMRFFLNIPKWCSLNFTQFVLYLTASLCCFIEVTSRNDGTIHFERNFGIKITSSVSSEPRWNTNEMKY